MSDFVIALNKEEAAILKTQTENQRVFHKPIELN